MAELSSSKIYGDLLVARDAYIGGGAYVNDSPVWTQATLTNNNQLTNGEGYYQVNDSPTFNTITTTGVIYAAGEIVTSGAALQVNGFQRTGNIYLHEGGNTPTANANYLSNTSGALEWGGNTVYHTGNTDTFSTTGTYSGVTVGSATTATKLATARTITLSGDLTGSANFDGSANISISTAVSNDSHTHTFNNLTSKGAGTGDYSTNGDIESGRGSGGVALTINDSQGNANVTFNHNQGTPEQNGNSARIVVNTDASTGANFSWELKSGVTGGVNINTPQYMTLSETGLTVNGTFAATGYNKSNWDSAYTATSAATSADTASTIVMRNGSRDIQARLFRSDYADQLTISGAMAFRVNNGADNYIRFCSSVATIRTYLGLSTNDSVTFNGITGTSGVFSGDLEGNQIGVNNTSTTTGHGLSLYGGANAGLPTYGMAFAGTATFGTYGGVTETWATYFTTSSTTNRGWIWRNGTTGIASLTNTGLLTLAGISKATDHQDNSDRRIKTDLELHNPLDIAQYATLYKYNKRGLIQYGVMAQDIMQYDKDIVGTRPDEEFKEIYTLSGYSLGAIALSGVGKLASETDRLKERVKELEQKVSELGGVA